MSVPGQKKSLALASLMLLSIPAAWLYTPRKLMMPSPPALADVIPRRFGDWRELKTDEPQVPPYYREDEGRPDVNNPYTDILARTYVNSNGDMVQLMLAYANRLSQEVKAHRPELCYVSQGFRILSHNTSARLISLGNDQYAGGGRLLAKSPGRLDAVSYWIRTGTMFQLNAWAIRYAIFYEGMHGLVPDGILVRVSRMIPGVESVTSADYKLQESFLTTLLMHAPARGRSLLLGSST